MRKFFIFSFLLFIICSSEEFSFRSFKRPILLSISDADCTKWMNPYRTRLGRPPLVGNGHASCADSIAKNDHISGVAHKYANICGPFKGQNECFRLTPNWNFDWCFNQWIAQRDIHLVNLRDATSVSCGYYWDGTLYTLTAFFQ